tara:strand:- start:98394 stop:99509 length:1116 start_codon:yes stop_codon:yes gene_type:complete
MSIPVNFGAQIRAILSPGISDKFLNQILAPEPLEKHFLRAFTRNLDKFGQASSKGKLDYEVLEAGGDRILKAVFQMYLFDIMGSSVTIPQPYSDMEKALLNTAHLSELADKLKFNNIVNLGPNSIPNQMIKEDMFESLVAAIVFAGDEYVAQDFGLCLAKRWLYTVFNSHLRDKIDVENSSKYVDYRTQLSEIWNFNGWGNVNYTYETNGGKCPNRPIPKHTISVNIIGSSHKTFPIDYQNAIVGCGYGFDKKSAKEDAARHAMEVLRAGFKDIKDHEVQYDKLTASKLRKELDSEHGLFEKIQQILQDPKSPFDMISTRDISIGTNYYVQIRVRKGNTPWKSYSRYLSRSSTQNAYIGAFKYFIQKNSKK